MTRISTGAVGLSLLAIQLTFAPTARAATTNDTPDTSAEQVSTSGGLETIVVTARRSSEKLQNVPVAVTALSGEFLDRQNIVDATALPRFAPNLLVAALPSNLSGATVYIRGIGNNEPSSVAEQGVGIYLDGVYIARSAGTLFDVADIERVEVLRGPQGTLFGRNTIGGAVQFVSRKPRDEFAMEAKAGYGRYNDWFVRSRVDTGFIGSSPIKLSITAQHRQNDGYINSTVTPDSQDPGSVKNDSIVIGAEADLGDVTATYSFDYNNRRGTTPFFQIVAATQDIIKYYSASPDYGGPAFLISPERQQTVQETGFVDSSGRRGYGSKVKVWGHALNLTYEASPALTLKSITGYRRFFQDTITDLSGNGDLQGVVLDPITFDPSIASVTPYTGRINPAKQRQFSQEFQALGTVGDFSYLAGAYYFHERVSEYYDQRLTFVLEGGDAGINLNPIQAIRGKAESRALFGQVSWKPSALDQKLELTGGLRYTRDKKTLTLAGDVQPNLTGKVSSENLSWLASASYELAPDLMVYARVSTGYRSGGINPRATVINTFKPEKAMAYEAGIKSEFFDHRLRLNLAGYITNYTDRQLTQFAAGSAGATGLIVNAGKVRLQGFEAEFAATPLPGFSLDGSVGYVHTEYRQFLFRDPVTDIVSDVADAAKPIYTPKWTLHLGGEYAYEFTGGLARLRIDYSLRTSIYFNALDATTPFNENIKSGTDRNVKARLSLEDIDIGGTKMEFGVWGDNLTNQKNIAYGIDFGSLGFAGAIFKKPITYGVDMKIVF
ncbi:hypothetical protein MB02_02750 [Croceicoccus estronivorus]|uniref:TonB-dependent receptor n=1 Tax=Croceicoccus estronivorus TaxID=1172626 RepID=UPI000832511A|nr:TonB-dependent receptor [Croceicoccus estronivorus]OCC25569.1 hypothetical protein MB02_02750 [Croceicoccus estronivorus]